MTTDEMISKLKMEHEEQKDVVAYLETQGEYAYYIEPHRQTITACEQLVEWLEELKNYQNQHNAMCENHKVKTIEDIYNKAIDDFVKKIEEHQQENWVDNLEYGITFSDIEQVAEQLKVGGKV